MEGKDIDKALVFIGIMFMLIGLAGAITSNRITNLENKVEELEKQSKEVHEYILNRIGG